MSDNNAPSCHQRPTWTRGDIVLGALVWTVVVLVVFAWAHRTAILAWLTALRLAQDDFPPPKCQAT